MGLMHLVVDTMFDGVWNLLAFDRRLIFNSCSCIRRSLRETFIISIQEITASFTNCERGQRT